MINMKSVPVPHVKVRKHLRLWGEVWEVQKARNYNVCWLMALPTFLEGGGGCCSFGPVHIAYLEEYARTSLDKQNKSLEAGSQIILTLHY